MFLKTNPILSFTKNKTLIYAILFLLPTMPIITTKKIMLLIQLTLILEMGKAIKRELI
jgi:hypothetical protein